MTTNTNNASRRIAQVNIPGNQHTVIGLTKIYGIGRSKSSEILKELKISESKKVNELSENEVTAITKLIEKKCKTEGELKREVSLSIKRLMEIGCYRGIRHRKGLPARGQSTKTNARTCKGPRKTVANKKKAS